MLKRAGCLLALCFMGPAAAAPVQETAEIYTLFDRSIVTGVSISSARKEGAFFAKKKTENRRRSKAMVDGADFAILRWVRV